MTPEELKALRKELSCTAKELAATLGVEQKDVLAWEKAELFPTKVFVDRMEALRAKGPSAIVRKAKGTVDPVEGARGPAGLGDRAQGQQVLRTRSCATRS